MFKNFIIRTSSGPQTLKIEVADSFIKRLLGLMGRKKIPQGQGLLLSPCNSIHMFFMRFSIDVIYLDKNYVIKKIVRNVKPFIGISICLKAESVIEMAAGEADRLDLRIGNVFETPDN